MDTDTIPLGIAPRVINLLNDIHRQAPAVLAPLIAYRVPGADGLADHPTVQVGAITCSACGGFRREVPCDRCGGFGDEPDAGGLELGLLGILNGLAGCRDNGFGLVVAHFGDEEHGNALIGFTSSGDFDDLPDDLVARFQREQGIGDGEEA